MQINNFDASNGILHKIVYESSRFQDKIKQL